MLSVKTNGKLYIAGEYQVLNKGGAAIIKGLSRGIVLNIKRSNRFMYISRGKTFSFTKEGSKLNFDDHHNRLVEKTFETTFMFLNRLQIPIKPFELEIVSELENSEGIKYGFGSSSAVITGIIKAVTKYNNVNLSNLELFKLAVLTQIAIGEMSSGGDIAAAIYGGWVYYERYDLSWIKDNIGKVDLLKEDWPSLVIDNINVPNIKIIAAWTKKAYHTKPLRKKIKIKQNIKARKLVTNLRTSLVEGKIKSIRKNIMKYDRWLKGVLKKSGRYTDELKAAIKIAKSYKLPAKISGAGGGDSAIIIYNKDVDVSALCSDLKLKSIQPFMF